MNGQRRWVATVTHRAGRLLAACGLLFILTLSTVGGAAPASTSGYLRVMGVLIAGAEAESDVIAAGAEDAVLLRTLRALARERNAIAKELVVPKDIASSHPHAVLVLEHAERAIGFAEAKKFRLMREQLVALRDEARVFRGRLAAMGKSMKPLADGK